MSDETTILSLPLIIPAQAQKHVTHNEALAILDVVVQLAVLNRDQTVPPALPALGDRHIVAPGATGAWGGQAGSVAVFTATGWQFHSPRPGWQAHVLAEGLTVIFDGTGWAAPAGGAISELPFLGLNATADTVNRLTVSAPATLLNHDGGGHQLKLNKALAGDTASLLFQTGFSGRAEMGTAGGDDFSIKVSADGAAFATAISVAAGSGRVSFPEGVNAPGMVLCDGTDPSRRAVFDASAIPAGTTRSYGLPSFGGDFMLLQGTQSVSGQKTFNGTFTVGAATASFGTNAGTATYGLASGGTGAGQVKTLNLATGGEAGSTTNVIMGPATGGAGGSLTVQFPTVTFGPTVAEVDLGPGLARAARLGVGGGTPDATTRLAVSSPAVLFDHAGAGVTVALSRAVPSDSAALSFRHAGSTRAEIGLLGGDGLSCRVSADGTVFAPVLAVDGATGRLTLEQPVVLAAQAADPAAPAPGMVWHNAAQGQVRARSGPGVRALGEALPFLVPPAGELVPAHGGVGGGTLSTLAGSAGRCDLYPFTPRLDVPADRLVVNCTTAVAGALAKIAVYAADASGRPDSLLFETADADLSTTGAKFLTVNHVFVQGLTYWLGLRHSSTAALSVWPSGVTADIAGGTVPSTAARKVLRRTIAYGTAAPATWGFTAGEINAALPSAIWLRVS